MESILELFKIKKSVPEPQSDKELNSVQALENFCHRLSTSTDSTTSNWGESLATEFEKLKKEFLSAKQTTQDLTPKDFLEKTKRRNGYTHIIAGPCWDTTIGDPRRDNPSIILSNTIMEIVGDPQTSIVELFPWPISERKETNYDDLGFKTKKGHMQLRAQYTQIKSPDEQPAGLILCVRRDVGGPMGEYWVGKGVITGLALKVPFETEAKYLEKT